MTKRLNWVLAFVALVALLGATIGVALDRESSVEAYNLPWPAANVVYNIYATDGYMNLADGTTIYTYGFIGGRQGQGLQYLSTTPKGVSTLVTYTNPTVPTVPNPTWIPDPSPGPVTAAELPLLGNAQVPGPVIYAAVGDIVRINFKNLGVSNKNAPNDPHTIHLHGIDGDAANDGVPETSVAGVPANSALPGAGNVITYYFYAEKAGTYMYHCHQEADIHVQMGMYGALVIYNPTDAAYSNGGPGKGFGGNLWGFDYTKDVIMLLTEVDVRQHVSEQNGLGGAAAFNPVNYQPQYWLINGLSFPNTIHADTLGLVWANWIAAHPNYDPFLTGSVSLGDKILLRVINLGFETQPMHVHGFHPKVIGSDQRAWTWANSATTPIGTGLEKNTLTIGSGETYELMFYFSTHNDPANYRSATSVYPTTTQTRYQVAGKVTMPVSNTLTAFLAIPMPLLLPPDTYIGGPTVGGLVGLPGTNPWFASSQFFPFHNHDDYKATNNGVYPGGQFTMVRLDP